MPAVSIIFPTYDRLRYLRPAIDSVLAQTFTDWELIIADDGSEEETRSYLRSLGDRRMRTLWLPHSGNPARVRNAALRMTTGALVAFLDSDDLWAAGETGTAARGHVREPPPPVELHRLQPH